MVWLKNFAGRIWCLWALFIFLPSLFLAIIFYTPCFFLKEPGKAKWHRKVSRIWMRFFLHAIGCPLKVKGQDHLKLNKSCIIICNHQSLLDIPATTPFMPRANKTIAKKSMSYIPIFGWVYSFGSVLVDRSNDASRRKSYDDMKTVLKTGLDMLIYPEGTRNTTGQPLAPFYDGAFKLAAETGNPVVPVLLFNTGKALPRNKYFYLWPHTIYMDILPPIHLPGYHIKELKEHCFNLMWQYYQQKEPLYAQLS
jgi:1-acyl-sn-glycerol-3-phosphate acyltransferase